MIHLLGQTGWKVLMLAQQATPGAASSTATAAEPQQVSIWQYIHQGGFLGYLLLALSVVAVGLVILMVIELQMGRMAPQEVIMSVGKCLREGNTGEALRYCQRPDTNCFLSRLFAGALVRCNRSQFGTLELRSALEDSGQREIERLYRSADWLALIAATGPMLGLLGTVLGMIGAFSSISAQQGAARSSALAGYMSLALVNTALGLAVAIPCTIAYGIFRRRIDAIAEQVADIAEGLASELEPGTPRPAARPAAAAPRPAAPPPPRPAPAAETREVRAS